MNALKPLTCILLLICAYLCGLMPARAQEPYFRHITQKDGLISDHMLSCVEDSLGYIWFSTQKGVTRFDGTKFKAYRPEDGLTEYFVFHASRRPNTNDLYFISRNFKVFRYDGSRFKLLKAADPIAWNTFDEKGEPVFLGRLGHILRLKGDSLVRIYSNPDSGMSHYHIRNIGKDSFIVSTHIGAFTFYNGVKRILKLPPFSFRTLVASRFFVLRDKRIFLFNSNGIYEFNPITQTLKETYSFPFANELYDMVQDPTTGDVWAGTLNGLMKFNGGVIDKEHVEVFLKNTTVCNLAISSDGLFIISTGGEGFFISSLNSVEIDLGRKGKKEVVNHIEKEGNDLYYFTSDGNIGLVNNGKTLPFKPNYKGALQKVLAVYNVGERGLALGTDKLHYIRNRKMTTGEWVDGEYLYATYFNDVYRPIFEENGEYSDMNRKFIMSSKMVHKLMAKHDPSNSSAFYEILLISLPRKIAYYPYNEGYMAFDFLTPHPKVTKHTLGSRVSCMAQLNDSTIIAGTHDKGVFILVHHKPVYNIDETNGLLSGHCYKLFIDKEYAWITTFGGLSRIVLDGKYNRVTNFSTNDVLMSGEVNDLDIVNNRTYVATGGGLCVFNRNLSFPLVKPRTVIEQISINERDTALASSYTLKYNQNNISITYNYPSIRTAGKVLYQYLVVKGNDTISKRYTSNGQLSLTALSPGEYNLLLMAKNSDGLWGDPTVLFFHITPPYWKTWWFISLITLAASALVMYIVLNRINVIRQQSSFKKQLVESELKALRLHMNPHFVFNSLTSLQSFILTNNNDVAASYITKFSRLLRLVMYYSQKGQILLSEEVSLLTRYIELEGVRFENQFRFAVTVDQQINQEDITIPSLVIQPFVENAIKYGLSGRINGMLRVTFSQGENMIVCVVEDNGVGRAIVMSQQERSGREYNPTGIKYTKDRLQLLFEDKTIEPVTIIDLYDEDGKARGTRVELKIPVL